MSSTRKTDNAAKTLSKIALEPNKRRELWNAIAQRMDTDTEQNETSTPAETKRRIRSNLGQLGAAVAAVILLVVGIPTLFHHYQGSRNVNTPSPGKSVVQPNSSNGHRTSKSYIEKYYTANHQTILKMSDYPPYDGEIVEASYGSTFAPEFDWWDLETGKRHPIAGPPYYLNLKQVLSANEVVFKATGVNSESPGVSFPFYVVAKRPNSSAQFTITNETAYLPVQQTVSFGDGKVESLSQLSLTSDGIGMGFSALKGREGNFAAGTYGAPQTSISFVSSKHELIVALMKTTLSVKQSQLLYMQNSFVQGVSVQSKGNEVQVILHLSSKTKFFTGAIDHKSSTPTLKLQFANTDQKPLV